MSFKRSPIYECITNNVAPFLQFEPEMKVMDRFIRCPIFFRTVKLEPFRGYYSFEVLHEMALP
jgi:hypothetical protein